VPIPNIFILHYNGLGILGNELTESRRKNGTKVKKNTENIKKVIILGGSPNRIGQGIEFDYCCVHTAFALRGLGFETIMINCNPETVSTDYDTSDKLYFEPLTVEDVLSICQQEKPLGVIVQFGGQTSLNIAMELKKAGVSILGTTPEVIALAENRDLFGKMMDKMGILMPESEMARNYEEAVAAADKIGYPVMVRPSYVLGGRAMEIVFDNEQLKNYIHINAQYISNEAPILIDRFLDNALECEADVVADGNNTFVPAIMEHIEYAGIHSGDSACVIPTVNITAEQIDTIRNWGPDSDGYYIGKNAAIGFRRLSIIDLIGGDQPIYNENKNLVIFFNGEIYNFKELRIELIAKGHVFTSASDTETVLHGYEEYGEEIASKLRGKSNDEFVRDK